MSTYTIGEIAKSCNVTVRTVQYYHERGILVPSAFSKGGRRIYSEDDLKKLKLICLLRNIGLSIDDIKNILKDNPNNADVSFLLKEHAIPSDFSRNNLDDIANNMKDNPQRPKRILINGGTIFVSRYTATYFVKKGYDVYVINRGNHPQVDGVKFIKSDRHLLNGILKNIHFDAVLDTCSYEELDVKDILNELESYDDYILISSSAFMEKILLTHPKQHIFNVGNREIIDINRFVEMCYEIVGTDLEKVYITDHGNQRDYFSFYDYDYSLNITEMEKLLPAQKNLYEGLTESYQWYREHKEDVMKRPYAQFIDEHFF